MRHRFDLRYKTWVHHDELDLPPPSPVIDNIRQSHMSDMTALLNDLSYIPLNNEHNETSNEPTQATRNEFKELYASTNEELYPGCDYVTRLDFMAKFTYFKVKGKLTDFIFNEMLEFFQNVFPISKGYKLPPSYYAIKKTFKMIRLGYESIHAYEHDCCLFWGDDNKDLDFCPVCNTSRWKDSNTPRKKVPKKVLRYFSIIPRLQRLYKSSHTVKEMIWHATRKCKEPGKMQHPVSGRAWKNFDTKYSDFAKEPRNVRLGLAADGFNPFGNLSQAYSMWPVILTTYNLPPWLCMKESSFMLTLLIPGPKSSGKDIDVYLRPLIEDLKFLWDRKCVETIDVALSQKFNMRAMVCPTCNEDTPSVRVLSKIAYVGHRRFLKKPHKWRRSLKFNGVTENGDPPREFNWDAIMTQLARLPTRVKVMVIDDKSWTLLERHERAFISVLKNSSIITSRYKTWVHHGEPALPPPPPVIDNTRQPQMSDMTALLNDLSYIPPNNEHNEPTQGDIVGKVQGIPTCNEDTPSVRVLSKTAYVGHRRFLKKPYKWRCLFEFNGQTDNRDPPKEFSQDVILAQLDRLPTRVKGKHLSYGGVKIKRNVHDDMLKAQIKVVDILCDLELIYPHALFNTMIHLVIHLLLEALEGGHIRPRWMFPFERYMKNLKGYCGDLYDPLDRY
ncbi:hypothetical protein Tco_0499063 [Tanacetum coccineum]